jgi:hypothetical protein
MKRKREREIFREGEMKREREREGIVICSATGTG